MIILATSDNLNMPTKSNSWYLDGTFKCSPKLFYKVLIIHAELSSDERTWCLPTVLVISTLRSSLFSFLSTAHHELAPTESKISCYRQGRQPPKRKKRCLEKDTSMKRIVENFHQYENLLLKYLDELAELC